MRSWKFTYGFGSTNTVLNEATDFWVTYAAPGDPPSFEATLHAVWQLSPKSVRGLEKRKWIEDALLKLVQARGRQGVLITDHGTGREMTYPGVVLDDINPAEAMSNKFLEVDLKFIWPSGGRLPRSWSLVPIDFHYVGEWDSVATYDDDGTIIPGTTYEVGECVSLEGKLWRAIQTQQYQRPPKKNNNAIWEQILPEYSAESEFLVINYSRQDNTAFKKPYRNAPVRIFDANDVTKMTISGLRQLLTGPFSTQLEMRQKAEAICKEWTDRIGKGYYLAIDGTTVGSVHLASATPGRTDLPDAFTYDLEFNQGFVDG